MTPNQRDIDDSVQDIFGDTSDEGSQGIDSLGQSDLFNDSSGPSRPSSSSGNRGLPQNPLDKVRDKLNNAQDQVRKVGDAAGKIKNGAQTVQNAAGKLAKGTGKLAEVAGKVEKGAGKIASAAGKVEKAAGDVEKKVGQGIDAATDVAALAEQIPGLLAAIPTLGGSELLALGAGGITEAGGKGSGKTMEAVGDGTKAIGEGTDALGKAAQGIGSATAATGQSLKSAGDISSGAGKGTQIGKSFLDEGIKGKLLKQILPFGTRFLGKIGIKNAEKETGSKVSTWQLAILYVVAIISPFLLAYFLIIMPVTYFFQMANGLMGQEADYGGGGGGGGGYDPVTGNAIVDAALRWTVPPDGPIRYSWAGGDCHGPTNGRSGNGFDCSGLTMYAIYQGTGICLDHYSQSQCGDSRGTKINNYADLQPGDLMCFGSPIHHVAIYMEPEKYVDAPQTGENVQVHPHSRTNDFRWGVRFVGTPPGGGGGGFGAD